MSTELIRLHFHDGVHIGSGSNELDQTAYTYGSDALKSALFAVGLAFFPEWKKSEKEFFEGFRISSAFPYCGDELFLPKPPEMRFRFASANDLTEAKLAKKIVYVSFDLFRRWAANQKTEVQCNNEQVIDGTFLFNSNREKKFLYTSIQQRVTVSSEGEGNTVPFYFERLFFAENSGLYFLIQFTNESLRPKILHALKLLGDAGIGTDRTVGNGQFTFDEPSPILLPVGNTGLQMSLGLYLPSIGELEDINLEESNWSLVKRGGYLAASEVMDFRRLRKKNIYFFGEGSTFRCNSSLQGRYVDLQPEWNSPEMHPIWRSGMPIFINL